jgi:hypothetical protein
MFPGISGGERVMAMLAATETVNSVGDLLGRLDGEMIGFLAVVVIGGFIGTVLGIVGLVTSTVNSIQRHRAELNFKREMVERGMSADDIARVITAASPETAPERCGQTKGRQRWLGFA